MKAFHRLHALRMENDAAGFAMDELRPRFQRLADRHENGTAPRAVVVDQLFQTPPALAEYLVGLLELKPGARILEPSAGLGRILDALKPFEPSEVVAVDINAGCTGELFRQERSGVVIKQRDFLSVLPAHLGLFDAVAMNPPFHMRSDIAHIKHALTFLKPGGKLAALCMNTARRWPRRVPGGWYRHRHRNNSDQRMKTIEPLLYSDRAMDPEPINMSLAEAATALREGQSVMVKLEPGDGTHYGLLITPAWAKHVSTHLGRLGITFMRSTDYLIVTKLNSRDGETFYSARGDSGEPEMTGITHPWTRQLLAWWIAVLWSHIRE